MRWKISLAMVLVFCAGAITGAVVAHTVIKHFARESLKFDNWAATGLREFEKKMVLSEPQKVKLKQILDQMVGEIKTDFYKTIDDSGRIIVRAGKQIDQELTPEQRVIHKGMKEEMRFHLKRDLNIDLPEE